MIQREIKVEFKQQIAQIFPSYFRYRRKRKVISDSIIISNNSTFLDFVLVGNVLKVTFSASRCSKRTFVLPHPADVNSSKKLFKNFLYNPAQRKRIMKYFQYYV